MRKQGVPVKVNRSGRVLQTCANCHNTFETVQSQVEKGNGKYCSRTCWLESRLAVQEGRICTLCKEYKSADAFGVNPQHPPRLRSHCHDCRKLHERKKRERDVNLAARQRRTLLLRQYNLTPEQYEEMARSQGYACAVCGTKNPGGNHAQLLVDHDHITGQVRGLLCNNCNTFIGFAGDNPEILANAIAYLKKVSLMNEQLEEDSRRTSTT